MPDRKILLIRLSSAGDVLLTSPLLRLIKEKEPNCEIHFVVKSLYADLVRMNPNVNKMHLVQDQSGSRQLESLRQSLIRERFDLTLDLHNNFRSIYLRRGTSRDVRVVKKEILKRALLVNVKLNLYSSVKSVAEKYAGTYQDDIAHLPPPEIYLPKESVWRSDQLWQALGTPPAASFFLCPGARHFTKRWPVDYWSELAAKLAKSGRVVLLGGTNDLEICGKIQIASGAVNYCGLLSFTESAAILRHASVVITNDSFLMHAANAVGRKVVAIFGSSVKEFGFFPYGIENRILEAEGLTCRPCSHIGLESCPRGHFKCMKEILPSSVERSARTLLGV